MDQSALQAAALSEEKLNDLRGKYEGIVFRYDGLDGEHREGGFDDLIRQCPHFRVLGAGAIRGTLDGMIEDGNYRKITSDEALETKKK